MAGLATKKDSFTDSLRNLSKFCNLNALSCSNQELYLELCQTPVMEFFNKFS